jgi:hypothetical protein
LSRFLCFTVSLPTVFSNRLVPLLELLNIPNRKSEQILSIENPTFRTLDLLSSSGFRATDKAQNPVNPSDPREAGYRNRLDFQNVTQTDHFGDLILELTYSVALVRKRTIPTGTATVITFMLYDVTCTEVGHGTR